MNELNIPEPGWLLRINPKRCKLCNACSIVCGQHQYKKYAAKAKEKGLEVKKADKNLRMALATIQVREGKRLPHGMTCAGCGKCVMSCPKSALHFNDMGQLIIEEDLCDLCDGNPKCVTICPQVVIRWVPVDDFPLPHPTTCDLCDGNFSCAKSCPTQAISIKHFDVPSYLER